MDTIEPLIGGLIQHASGTIIYDSHKSIEPLIGGLIQVIIDRKLNFSPIEPLIGGLRQIFHLRPYLIH